MWKFEKIVNTEAGITYLFKWVESEPTMEPFYFFKGVGELCELCDEYAEPITPAILKTLTDEEKREEFSRLMAMIQPRINMPPLHGYSEDLDEDADEDEDLELSVVEPENLVDYQLIKNIIGSNSKDALKLGVMVRTLAVQKLRTILEDHEKIQDVFVFDRDKDQYLTDYFTALLYLNSNIGGDDDKEEIHHIANLKMSLYRLYFKINQFERNSKVSDGRYYEILKYVTENVQTLFKLDTLLNN